MSSDWMNPTFWIEHHTSPLSLASLLHVPESVSPAIKESLWWVLKDIIVERVKSDGSPYVSKYIRSVSDRLKCEGIEAKYQW